MSHRTQLISSVERARDELLVTLAALDKVPEVDRDGIAFASHALNNYLSVCAGTIDLLSDALRTHPDEEVRIFVDALRHATDLMSHSVCRLVHTPESEPPRLSVSPVNLTKLVGRVCEFYIQVAGRKLIAIHFTPNDDIPFVWTDRVAIAAILDNFFSNAVKYSSPGTRIWANIEQEGEFAVCSVRDEGPGLSPEDLRKVFDRGAKLTPKPTAGEPSMGYGLSVAKHLADRLGGTVSCESTLGEGTTFYLLLPLNGSPRTV